MKRRRRTRYMALAGRRKCSKDLLYRCPDTETTCKSLARMVVSAPQRPWLTEVRMRRRLIRLTSLPKKNSDVGLVTAEWHAGSRRVLHITRFLRLYEEMRIVLQPYLGPSRLPVAHVPQRNSIVLRCGLCSHLAAALRSQRRDQRHRFWHLRIYSAQPFTYFSSSGLSIPVPFRRV